MNHIHKKRLAFIATLIVGISVALSLVLVALRQNINLFYTPTQVVRGEAPQKHLFRVGGLVRKGSVVRAGNDLNVRFVLTDTANDVIVSYQGILPDLFREGQGVVAQGNLNGNGVFVASEVLAKHDEKYMPPQVAQALKQARK